ncbi:MAG: tRNA lysidine(34) synthetase TilS [Rhodoblastus sp.]|nr:MAG: tRNA lysidine(34) synthetase TilS [Rhodoblastus sp.]
MLSATAAGPPGEAEFDAAFAPWARETILLAVSGGPDSTALAAAAVAWRERTPGPPLAAAIVDHGLRAGSGAEADAAAARCGALGLPVRRLVWTGEKPAAALQERARAARYALLAQAARDLGAGVVMTAHHADDQVETILFRLLRGSGPAGLAGMAARTARDGVEIARPFLVFPKSRLLAYLAERGLDAASDPSNDDPRFARVRLRALIPALAREGASPALFARFARRARRAELALEAAAAATRRDLARPDGVDAAALFAAPEEIRLRVLRAMIVEAGGGEPRLDRLEALEARLAAAWRAGAGARMTLATTLLELRDGRLALRAAPPRRGPHAKAVLEKPD